ncbi:hypothetical protein PISMIDRAFT_678166 [Pisolithus microcarpus 441]|uniref:Unplaced genomic scaffold scaffold_31, whole genome shotgun sequence n=1 Tax=Pisolithus microcarpus 441 TaxID=765257 RepID=A0A0C9ZF58_9AGAM|nr:hypothetical protein PISMIDRAFT_678166 [Pisolithus microcarpus 441]
MDPAMGHEFIRPFFWMEHGSIKQPVCSLMPWFNQPTSEFAENGVQAHSPFLPPGRDPTKIVYQCTFD